MADTRATLMRYPPPFTPSGRASLGRPHLSTEEDSEVWTGQWGLLLRWRADRHNAEVLLPKPLEPVPNTDRIYCFLDQTQLASRSKVVEREHPQLTNWHEAVFLIPCAYQGARGVFSWISYKDFDLDYHIVQGTYRGLATKGASFITTFPEPSQPLNREMAPGGVARMLVSRWDESLIGGTFVADAELSAAQISDRIDLSEFASVFAMRFLPDFFTPGPPLVHDLVLWRATGPTIARAWSGEGEITLSRSENDELDLLTPVEMLECYFIHYHHQAPTGTVLYDYLAPADGSS